MAWIEQTGLPYVALGVASLLFALLGLAIRIRGSAYEEMFTGSPYEIQFIFGTILVLIFGPLGLVALIFAYLR